MALEVIVTSLTLRRADRVIISADDPEIIAAAKAFERAQSTLRTILGVCFQGWEMGVPGMPVATHTLDTPAAGAMSPC